MGRNAVRAILGIVAGVVLMSVGAAIMSTASGGNGMLWRMTLGIVAAIAGVVVAGLSLRPLLSGDRCPSCKDPVVKGAYACPNCGHAYAS
jgi:hypothetical protein